jgi:plastocyanin
MTKLQITALLLLSAIGRVAAAIVNVDVGPGGELVFSPAEVTIQPGDTIKWTWRSDHHSVTSTTNLFDTDVRNSGFTFSFTFNNAGTYNYYCIPHGGFGMQGIVNVGAAPTPTPTPAAGASQLLNISTRMRVQTGENVMIGGFIVTGTQQKKVLVRAIGPSLAQSNVSDFLADPMLELHAGNGALIAQNNNWKDTQQAEIEATTVPPKNDLESAIVSTLPANNSAYTAVVQGANSGTGVGLVEVYDLNQAADSTLANISTRGFVLTDTNVMIGGFILGNASGGARVIARGIGPSLAQSGVGNALADPTLQLRDSNGALVRENDNWKDTQATEIQQSGVAPANDLESAIIATLPPGPYTAILAGKNRGTGVGLVELYNLK